MNLKIILFCFFGWFPTQAELVTYHDKISKSVIQVMLDQHHGASRNDYDLIISEIHRNTPKWNLIVYVNEVL